MARAKTKTEGGTSFWDKLDKEFEDLVYDLTSTEKPAAISTGSFTLDMITGIGGIPIGKITQIEGWEYSGKTTLALCVAREAQKLGLRVVFMDFEGRFVRDYAEDIGINLDPAMFKVYQPLYIEQGDEIFTRIINADEADVFIFDSIAMMNPKDAMYDDKGNLTTAENSAMGKRLGYREYKIGEFGEKICKLATQRGKTIIFLNQMRTNIKLSQYESGPDEKPAGGRKIPYFLSMRINLKMKSRDMAIVYKPGTGKKEKKAVRNVVRATILKTNFGKPYDFCDLCISYGKGVDNIGTLIHIAVNKGTVAKNGAMYVIGKKDKDGNALTPVFVSVRGQESLHKYLSENTDARDYLFSVTMGNAVETEESDDEGAEE